MGQAGTIQAPSSASAARVAAKPRTTPDRRCRRAPEQKRKYEYHRELRLGRQAGQRRAGQAVVPPFHQRPGQGRQEEHQDGGLPDKERDYREPEKGHGHQRHRPRHAGDGVAQQITRQQEQLEVEGEPGQLRSVISQWDQEGAAGGEPGGVIVGQEIVVAQPVGRLVPAVFMLNPGLERLVVRTLARGDDLPGRPVADEVGIDLIPGRELRAGPERRPRSAA